jgi:TRAP-type mannitol/chloroaromatic compound transport system permease small subunit
MRLNWLDSSVNVIDKFTDYCGKAVAWLTLLMVLLSTVIVVLRYGFGLGWIALQESVLYFHSLVFMLGAAYTLKADGHVRVDIFYQKYSLTQKAWVNLIGCILLLLPFCGFVFYISFEYVSSSWQIMEKSSEAGGLPLVFVSKSFLLLLALTLALQGLAEIGRNILLLNNQACQIGLATQPSTKEGK